MKLEDYKLIRITSPWDDREAWTRVVNGIHKGHTYTIILSELNAVGYKLPFRQYYLIKELIGLEDFMSTFRKNES
jgi:hypothetical protein